MPYSNVEAMPAANALRPVARAVRRACAQRLLDQGVLQRSRHRRTFLIRMAQTVAGNEDAATDTVGPQIAEKSRYHMSIIRAWREYYANFEDLIAAIDEHVNHHNTKPKPFISTAKGATFSKRFSSPAGHLTAGILNDPLHSPDVYLPPHETIGA
jgi:hypothetical protein